MDRLQRRNGERLTARAAHSRTGIAAANFPASERGHRQVHCGPPRIPGRDLESADVFGKFSDDFENHRAIQQLIQSDRAACQSVPPASRNVLDRLPFARDPPCTVYWPDAVIWYTRPQEVTG